MPIALALRHHRLPRYWLGLTLGLVAAGVGGVHWWEQQLPSKLQEAASAGRLDACIRYADQLAALRWLGGRAPQDQGLCRRRKAAQLWQQEHWAAAMKLQLQLVNSVASRPADQRLLVEWQRQLEARALDLFQQGNLQAALVVLAAINADHRSDGAALGDTLRDSWTRNRLLRDRGQQLIKQQRWWEALDALNRIDHPWWKVHSQELRQQVQKGIASLRRKEDREHEGHSQTNPSNVSIAELDALISRKIAAGMDDWQAFERACRELGGKVVETGPESACRR
jgi:hypothetical protein